MRAAPTLTIAGVKRYVSVGPVRGFIWGVLLVAAGGWPPGDREILRTDWGIAALVQLATASGADVIAEGVETEGEPAALIDIDVRYGQGYHLAHPAPLDRQTHQTAS